MVESLVEMRAVSKAGNLVEMWEEKKVEMMVEMMAEN
jgi:hypothetical protein